ncbi:adenosine kinase [Novosphingopyxis sp. YJ-S2-01]|uniref:adenosine kinase n=1 Tax=Novosphingopyxis sp. YJ-S2-01 TaxID=2794021 RepID=UPI0018DE6130|nr:adenosine kinase [Novosphingopyxis sp. YJ-S2-01]MBH9536423.1 adenosine kinase [Novosphingopyxis sp. YJ-S2-01]
MTDTTYDVLAIGNAIVDVLAQTDDQLIADEGLTKGGMSLIDADRAVSLYEKMGQGQEISGGAAANTLAGLAMLGAKCRFIGQVAKDQLGEVYAHDLGAVGVDFTHPPRDGDVPTGRCLILVSPDGERTMNTFLGASHYLPGSAIDEKAIAGAKIVFLEGYMWDPPEPRAAMRRALEIARESDTQIAFSTCADFCVHTHRKDFRKLIDDGLIDILFANEEEAGILEDSDPEAAIESLGKDVPLLVVTRGPNGAIAVKDGERFETKALPTTVVDTTGAGDLFAAGFLSGHLKGESVTRCLEMGAVAAAEVVSHFGARPEQDLTKLMAEKLG